MPLQAPPVAAPFFLRAAAKGVNGQKTHLVYVDSMNDSLERLYEQVIAAKTADPAMSRTAKLMRAGRSKVAKKLAEEAIEVVIDLMHGQSDAVVRESADLLYNLVVLWAEAGIRPQDVFAEMARRERLFGLAEKLPKKHADSSARRKVVVLEARRKTRRR
jgi:phosphoribosyl-ATP pyrophosphohydrolase